MAFITYIKRRITQINRLFWFSVALPTAASVVYNAFWVSDVYTSESKFVVRSPERQASSPFGVLLKGVGFSKAQDESYSVQDFILSRDALKVLNEEIGLDKAYASKTVDIFSRFAGLDHDNSFEALHRYYQEMVKVQTDSVSSINALTVKAFTAQDAYNANRLLLEQSESLVNRLNERGRQDMIRFAAREVNAAQAKAAEAALALSKYRNRQGVVDPEVQARTQLQQVGKLQEELIATRTQIAQLNTYAPKNPQLASLETRARTLEQEISNETGKVTGGDKSLTNKASEFERLTLESKFANQQLASAMASLETARNEAQRQQVYLERIVQPSLPDVAQDPNRLKNILATLVLGLAAWGILTMLLAGIREHQD